MWTSVIPWPWRALAVGLVLIAAGVIGWLDGASHVHKQWDAEMDKQAVVVAQQAARTAHIETQQVKVTQEVGNVVETRIDAVHKYYAGRVRQRPADSTGSMPAASGSPGNPDPAPADDGYPPAGSGIHAESYGRLAERCAVTTEVALGWQSWWAGIVEAGK